MILIKKQLCGYAFVNVGNEVITTGNHLRTGHTKSCGCLNKKNGEKNPSYKHGKRKTRLYKIFYGMKQRCYNKKNPRYKNYGEKGIKICDEWLDNFMNFYSWAIENGYKDDLTIDRINNGGDYEPNNCRWLTRQAQNWNTTRTKNIPPKEILLEFKKA